VPRDEPEAQQLWADHVAIPFPDGLGGEEVAGIDLVLLDAEVAGCIQTWLSNDMRLDEPHRTYLVRCADDLDRVLPLLNDRLATIRLREELGLRQRAGMSPEPRRAAFSTPPVRAV
jgi:hypothetical protein